MSEDEKYEQLRQVCVSYRNDCEKLEKENTELKQQLAKKDKEYQAFKKIADENVNYLKNRILEETRNHNQDKIELLEKVESYIKDITYIKEPDYTNVCEYIRSLIKEIKGE